MKGNIPEQWENSTLAPFNQDDIENMELDDVVEDNPEGYTLDDAYDDGLLD